MKDHQVRIDDENYKKISDMACKERRTIKTMISIAFEFFFKQKEKK